MTVRPKFKLALPFIFLFILLSLLGQQLFYADTKTLPSALIGEPIPTFGLPHLFSAEKIFTQKDLFGRVTLLNVWATWCEACLSEHQMLMKIRKQYHVPLYGIDYKDNQEKAIAWLQKEGNPFLLIGKDSRGDAAIDLGVYGTPETFVISPQGMILYRHVGVIDEKVWNDILYPLIKKYEHAR